MPIFLQGSQELVNIPILKSVTDIVPARYTSLEEVRCMYVIRLLDADDLIDGNSVRIVSRRSRFEESSKALNSVPRPTGTPPKKKVMNDLAIEDAESPLPYIIDVVSHTDGEMLSVKPRLSLDRLTVKPLQFYLEQLDVLIDERGGEQPQLVLETR